jgi:hypothetical protein
MALLDDDFEMIDSRTLSINPTAQSSYTVPTRERSSPTYEMERVTERALDPLVAVMQKTVEKTETRGPIFHGLKYLIRTSISKTFINLLPAENAPIMHCKACVRFMNRYGDLCVVGDDGNLIPLMWPTDTSGVPQYYKRSVEHVLQLFKDASVQNEFETSSRVLGTPRKGGWTHMAISLQDSCSTSGVKTQNTNTSFSMLERILKDNSMETIARAYHLILNDQLPYCTSHKAAIEWLKQTAENLAAQYFTWPVSCSVARGQASDGRKACRENLVTRYARSTFPGCLSSLRSGLIGVLLEGIRNGDLFETMRMKWVKKANPHCYLRPTSDPSISNIKSAEKLFAKLGYTPYDLERQYLTLDQVPPSGILWSPCKGVVHHEVSAPDQNKLFAHLLPDTKAKLDPYTDTPVKDISFRQFVLKVLPDTATIEIFPEIQVEPYFFITGKPNSKPIMNFHKEGSHTASWYAWSQRRVRSLACMKNEWTAVTSIISFPHMWDDLHAIDGLDEAKAEGFKYKRYGIHYLITLQDAREYTVGQTPGLMFFPTLLKEEFYPVSKTVEKFSSNGTVQQPKSDAQQVAGLAIRKDIAMNDVILGVRSKANQVSRYRITLFE